MTPDEGHKPLGKEPCDYGKGRSTILGNPLGPQGIGLPRGSGMLLQPIRLQHWYLLPNRPFPRAGAQSPPRTPPHRSRSGTPMFSATGRNQFPSRIVSSRPHTTPFHTPRFRHLGRRTHLEPRPASQTPQGHGTQAHSDCAEGSALVTDAWKRKARDGSHMRK